MSTEVQFNPGALLDALMSKLGVHTDAALARALNMTAPTISKTRHGSLPIGPTLLANASEVTGIKVRDLRALMGDRRKNYRLSGSVNRYGSKVVA